MVSAFVPVAPGCGAFHLLNGAYDIAARRLKGFKNVAIAQLIHAAILQADLVAVTALDDVQRVLASILQNNIGVAAQLVVLRFSAGICLVY